MSDFDNLPWDKVQDVLEFDSFKMNIPNKSVLEFALKEENYPKLVESALKSLQKKDPEASEEQAKALADTMKEFAQKLLDQEQA